MAVLRGSVELVIPICERPASKSTPLAKLLRWRSQSRHKASSISTALSELDGGPDSSELLTELEWLLDDAVESCVIHRPEKRKIQGWRRLKSALELEECGRGDRDDLDQERNDTLAGHGEIFLRASLEELEQGWKERIDRRRPFQYVTGSSHWRDLVLGVQEGVLIPRPETKQLIDLAAAAMDGNSELARGVWVDLGTGSGAIAIGIARLLDGRGSVIAVDASEVAIAVAEANARRYKLQEAVTLVKGSWLTPLRDEAGKLSGIVSNPPYIPSRNLGRLQAEVGKHEPICALDGGVDGIDHLAEICQGACWALKSGGFLALETDGGEQAQTVAKILSDKPFEDIKVVKDFAEMSRFVTAFHT
ncbi:uncharacterized protein LOC9645295 [Selaginella moellendorffii]|uniref:uncharacterized protein LOC9645295 n=1 Tax=Selaginella moellendorffii TaxID=88036 RepID=UPI000D1CDFEC|nr:uncharacterized protein LOC9645295 [Selaginella moellendorffii]|eukprot:XP_024536401.1 uncharacterized protein LOC9645295 [Selaginella moellendorffii]